MASGDYLEIMDTTLRDGEQTPGIAFTPMEKLQIAKILLEKVRVNRIEVASARVSEGEMEGAAKIIDWAARKGKAEQVEILGFADGGKSIEWIKQVGGKVINLLTKGSELHCRVQLRKTPEEHFTAMAKDIERAAAAGLKVNVYLEDWSNGMRDSFPYVHEMTKRLVSLPVERVMLPDTLGTLNPITVERYLDWMMSSFPDLRFDFHGHNDYGLGTANSLAAALKGVGGVHVTVNSLGERAGNPSLCQVVAAIHDMSMRKTKVNERHLDYLAATVEAISGKRLAANSPIVGNDVFTQTCGVHADGDKKGNLYATALAPERFGRKRHYALGKLSGKASIDKNLENLGLELDEETRTRVLKEVIRLGDKKKRVTPEDLPFIIADVLKTKTAKSIEITDYHLATRRGVQPMAEVEVLFRGEKLSGKATGDGGYDAFMKAIRSIMRKQGISLPKLVDYEVRIPPGGKTDALVEAAITWAGPRGPMITSGVDSDQLEAAIEATTKMLNLVLADA